MREWPDCQCEILANANVCAMQLNRIDSRQIIDELHGIQP